MKTYKRIYKLVKKIPKGKIATYAQIGIMTGVSPRVVGWALNRLAKFKTESTREEDSIPWQRVINSKGKISTNKLSNISLGLQKELLMKEGIKFNNEEEIDLKKYRWSNLYNQESL